MPWLRRRGDRFIPVKAGVGGDAHDDSTVGSVVRSGQDGGSSPAQARQSEDPSSHRSKAVEEVELSAAPFTCGEGGRTGKEGVRRYVKGRMYGDIEAKRAAVEAELRRVEVKGRISTQMRWSYTREAFQAQPG